MFMSLLESIEMEYCWGVLLESIVGEYCWGVLLGSIVGEYCWRVLSGCSPDIINGHRLSRFFVYHFRSK